jgi:hypothetical protein
MTKDNQSNKKTPSIINRKPQSGLDEQTTWRKLDEKEPKSELQVEFEQAFIASAADSEKQIVNDKQAKKAAALLAQKERISNLKEKRMLLVAQTQGKGIEQIPSLINRTPPVSKKLKAMELAREMAEKGLCKDEPGAFDSQVEEMMGWDDIALDSMWHVVAEQKTWRKLNEQRPKSELEELEKVFDEMLLETDTKALKRLPLAGVLEEPDLSLMFRDPIEGFPPPYDNQPPVIELGSFETWDCNKVSFTKRDPVIPEHGKQLIDNPFFGLLATDDKCNHPNDVNGFCTTCGSDVMVSVGDPPTKADVIVKQVQDRLKANNGYGQDKYPHQINVKLTDEDMKRAEAIKKELCMEDMSGSQLMRMLIRQGMKKHEENK